LNAEVKGGRGLRKKKRKSPGGKVFGRDHPFRGTNYKNIKEGGSRAQNARPGVMIRGA